MPSPSALKFRDAMERASTLARLSTDKRLRPLSREHSRFFLHAALAASVAAWEAYSEGLVADFYREIFDVATGFARLHAIAKARAEKSRTKFNTPNSEQTRELLLDCTGYDPINEWTWPARNMTGPLVRERLNEIVRVRHSFAHGLAMPSFSWNVTPGGSARLDRAGLNMIEAFFKNIVTCTDTGMSNYIRTNFNPHLNW